LRYWEGEVGRGANGLKLVRQVSIPSCTLKQTMIIERVNLQHIKQQDHVSTLQALEVGESIYCDDARKAQSIRVLSYYLVRSRKLERKFVFRKMDRGWRIIRVI
jgi:hypothetical protein